MSDIKLFKTTGNKAAELKGSAVALERSLQALIEKNLEAMMGVRLLASEHYTGKVHNGRIDTLGVDENFFPVIIEYKRATNENVITQGLYYLDWLMDHQADFRMLVMEKLGKESADKVDFSWPRLLCIAGDFSRYDTHAVNQMDRSIELIRYKHFKEDLLLFEWMNTGEAAPTAGGIAAPKKSGTKQKTFTQYLADLDPAMQDLYEQVRAFLLAMGDDVQVKVLEQYEAYKRLKNFATVVVYPSNKYVRIYVRSEPGVIPTIQDLVRDVTNVGHWGTGNVELTVRSVSDLEAVKSFVLGSYEQS